ncbi:UNVERIFIED_CONTAM: hypothetical protein HDU68_010518 [Siphonaria sp. JEL0065]|nr:hypothetical protein HDU68_010518 [Siphonaria sp. JEL0065]
MNTPVSADRGQLLDALMENLGGVSRVGPGLIEFCVERGEAAGLRELLRRCDEAFVLSEVGLGLQQQQQPLLRYLKKCIWAGDLDCLEVLLERMGDSCVGSLSSSSSSLDLKAAVAGAHGGSIGSVNSSNSGGGAGDLLTIAVERGRIGVLDRLLTVPGIITPLALNRALCVLAKGAVDSADAMHRADIAGKLVLAGADVSGADYEAFKSAAASGDSEVLKVLVREVVGSTELKRRRSTLGVQAAAAAAAVVSGSSAGLLASPVVSPVSALAAGRPAIDLGTPASSAPMPRQGSRLSASANGSQEAMTETDHCAIEKAYMIVAQEGHGASMKVLLDESRTWNMVGGVKRILVPATLEAIKSGWVGVVRAITESKCWLEIVKEVGGEVLLDRAARYVFENEALSLDEGVRIRKLLERPVAQIDGDGVIPHSAAMVEAMVAGVAGTTAARFTAFETTIMKKGIDSHSFLLSAKPNDRDSPFQDIKDKILLQAVWLGHESVMDAIITVLQPDLTGPIGQSVLIAATCQGHTKIVASLISAGVDFESGGGVVFDIAQDRGHTDTLKHLNMMRTIRVKVAKDAEAKAKERAKKRQTTVI